MPTPVTPPRRGSKPRHAIDMLRTRLWFHVVKLRSGLPSAYAIELALEPYLVKRSADGIVRPGKWDTYEDGSRVPQRMVGKQYSVDVAEARYPGTAAYFDSAIWPVLRGEKLAASEIERQLHLLSDDVVAVLFSGDVRGDATQWRRREFDEAAASTLANIGSFDALVAAVLLVAKSEAIALPRLRDLAFNCYLALQSAVEGLPEIAPFASELFLAIDNACKHWVFPTTQSRLDVVIFSHELRDAIAIKEREDGTG